MSNSLSAPATETAAPVFAALGDETRLALLSQLCDGRTRSIAELTHGTGLSRQGVRKHLAVLEQACVVTSKLVGRDRQFTVRPDTLTKARQYLDRASRQWDDAIERLKLIVEK